MPLLEEIKNYKNYLGITPVADDFDEYWEEALKELDKKSLEFELKETENDFKDILTYDLYFKGMNNERVHCLYTIPKDIKGKIPAVVFYHGYKSNAGSIYQKVPYVYNNIATLSFEVQGQGGKSEDRHIANGPTLYGQIIRGVDDKDKKKLFYRSVYLSALKAIRILKNFEYIDEKRIAVTGKSQGGALSIISAALDNDIKLCAPIYPFLCDFKKVYELNLCDDAYKELRDYFRKYDPLHETEDEFFKRLSYIDIKNFATKIECEVMWFTALEDRLCHPITQMACYNKITSKKSLKIYPEYAHEDLLYSDDIIFSFIVNNI